MRIARIRRHRCNRLTKYDSVPDATTSYTYNDLDQLLSSNDGTTETLYGYDSNGNMIARGIDGATTTFMYDINNKMIAATAQGQSSPFVKYYYNYRGNRFLEEQPGVAGSNCTYYQVDNNNLTGYSQVLAEFSETGIVSGFYSYGHDLTSLTVSPQTESRDSYTYHYDGLGSTRVLTNSGGGITNKYGYTAFGNAVSSLTSQTYPQAYRFTGERSDSQTGFYYFRARMYDPIIGRFVSFDPIEDRQNMGHKYNYVANDPVNITDPTGGQISLGGLILIVFIIGLLASMGCSSSPHQYIPMGSECELEGSAQNQYIMMLQCIPGSRILMSKQRLTVAVPPVGLGPPFPAVHEGWSIPVGIYNLRYDSNKDWHRIYHSSYHAEALKAEWIIPDPAPPGTGVRFTQVGIHARRGSSACWPLDNDYDYIKQCCGTRNPGNNRIGTFKAIDRITGQSP